MTKESILNNCSNKEQIHELFQNEALVNRLNRENEIGPHMSFDKDYWCKNIDSLTIDELIECVVKKTPNLIAVQYKELKLTYKELNERANQLARKLISLGVSIEDVVGIMLDRSVNVIVAILGILKAGAGYLPIDPRYPKKRIDDMLEDSQTKILIVESMYIERIKFNGRCILIDECMTGTIENVGRICKPENLAYLIYTSGSTGVPKGVMIEHRNVINLICSLQNKLNFNQGLSILCLTTISFDIFVLETLVALSSSMRIVIASEEEQSNPELLKNLLFEQKIDVAQMTPSSLKMIAYGIDGLQILKYLKILIIGGEPFPEQMKNQIMKNLQARVYNAYGPTETTVWSTIKEISIDQPVTIGKPIDNTQIYILNDKRVPVSLGEIGQIFISGHGVARGYRNYEITKERFIQNPFIEGKRMYFTGDLGKWLPNGEIDFCGRSDYQVKIRGFRIELGEIERVLLCFKGIKNAVITVLEDQNLDKLLYAYYESEEYIFEDKLREFIQLALPKYMVPNRFYRIDKMPMTANGKIDRNALLHGCKKENINPENKVEAKTIEQSIITIIKEELNVNEIDVNCNLDEIGGNSLSTIKIISKIEKIHKIILNPRDFISKSVKQIAEISDNKMRDRRTF